MVNYRAILLYYTKGNTNTQISTICGCSRPTIIKTIKRARELNLKLPIDDNITDQQLFLMLFPKKGRKEGYYYPDFHLLDKDRKKRSFSKFRAWQKYCRVSSRMGLRAYKKTQFYKLYYLFYHKPFVRATSSKNLMQVRLYEALAARMLKKYGTEHTAYLELDHEITMWCHKLRLDKQKLWTIESLMTYISPVVVV